MECTICQIPKHSWSGCPSPPSCPKLTILLQQLTRSPFLSHYPPSADSVKEPQLIVKAVYVSSLAVITQCGITNRGNWNGGCCVWVCYHGVNFLVMGQLLWWHIGLQIICVNTAKLIIHTVCSQACSWPFTMPPTRTMQSKTYTSIRSLCQF